MDLPKFPCKCVYLCFPSAAPLWKHYSCSCTSSACHSRSICFKKDAHTIGWPCPILVCLFPPLLFPLKAVLVWRITSTPLTIPPHSGMAHAIRLSPMPALLSFFHSPVLLRQGLFYGTCLSIPRTHSSRFSLCFSSSKRPSSALGATPCSSVNESLPLLNTIHLDTSLFTTLHS